MIFKIYRVRRGTRALRSAELMHSKVEAPSPERAIVNYKRAGGTGDPRDLEAREVKAA